MLVNCVAYQEGKKLTDIPKQEIGAYLGRPDCFVGVALRAADAVDVALFYRFREIAWI